jgi:hypothetical protein
MAPDFEYYWYLFPRRTISHSTLGVFALCLPSGLVVLAMWRGLVRGPLLALVPSRWAHLADAARERWTAQAGATTSARLLTTSVALVLGSFSHVWWDACTHRRGWVVERVPLLSTRPLSDLGSTLPVHAMLQVASTFAGLAALAAIFVRWARRQPRLDVEAHAWPRTWPVLLLALVVLAPGLGWRAIELAHTDERLHLVGKDLFGLALIGVGAGVALSALLYGIATTLAARR